jgi:hypothetical protein
MANGDARVGKWRGNSRMEWVASTLHTTSDHGVSSITTADVHTSAAGIASRGLMAVPFCSPFQIEIKKWPCRHDIKRFMHCTPPPPATKIGHWNQLRLRQSLRCTHQLPLIGFSTIISTHIVMNLYIEISIFAESTVYCLEVLFTCIFPTDDARDSRLVTLINTNT